MYFPWLFVQVLHTFWLNYILVIVHYLVNLKLSWDLLVVVLMVCICDFLLILFWFMYLKILNSDPDKHYLMYEHERVPIAVCEKEPSSIIAFALRYYSWGFSTYGCIFIFYVYLLIAVFWVLLHRVEQNISKCKILNISKRMYSLDVTAYSFCIW